MNVPDRIQILSDTLSYCNNNLYSHDQILQIFFSFRHEYHADTLEILLNGINI